MQPPFRRNLLAARIEFICRCWHHHHIVTNYRIGESIINAQTVALALRKAAK